MRLLRFSSASWLHDTAAVRDPKEVIATLAPSKWTCIATEPAGMYDELKRRCGPHASPESQVQVFALSCCMRITLGLVVMVAVVALGNGCGNKGTSGEYMHENPHFTVSAPSDLVAGKDKVDGASGSLSIANKDGSRELFFVWARSGSPLDPVAQFGRYGHEPDSTKIVEQGELPPTGKFVINERGGRTYIHKVITNGADFGILCMASTKDPKKDADLLAACKTLELN